MKLPNAKNVVFVMLVIWFEEVPGNGRCWLFEDEHILVSSLLLILVVYVGAEVYLYTEIGRYF